MTEFLIKRTDDEWFDLKYDQFSAALHPDSYAWEKIEGWGDFRIKIADAEVAFSFEDPGIQVCFESGTLSKEAQTSIVGEVLSNIEKATGNKGRVVPI